MHMKINNVYPYAKSNYVYDTEIKRVRNTETGDVLRPNSSGGVSVRTTNNTNLYLNARDLMMIHNKATAQVRANSAPEPTPEKSDGGSYVVLIKYAAAGMVATPFLYFSDAVGYATALNPTSVVSVQILKVLRSAKIETKTVLTW